MSVENIRKAVRRLFPEERHAGGLAMRGKVEMISAIRARGYEVADVRRVLGLDEVGGGDTLPLPAPAPVVAPAPAGVPVAVAPAAAVGGDKLDQLRAILLDGVTVPGAGAIDENAVRAIVEDCLKDRTREVVVTVPEVGTVNVGRVHACFDKVLQDLACGLHVMLVGPAGSGKTTIAEKAAAALQLDFYPVSVGPQTTKSDLLGYVDANGNYHTTPVRDAFEKGGLLLLDEIDAGNAGVLTILNSMLANGHCSFPDGIIKRHENFRCMCAGNTFGRGADCQYVGRNRIDEATLNRFMVVYMDYDEDLEREICGNRAFAEKVQKYRHIATEIRARVVISPRQSIFGARLIAAGVPEDEAIERAIFAAMPEDIARQIKSRYVA